MALHKPWFWTSSVNPRTAPSHRHSLPRAFDPRGASRRAVQGRVYEDDAPHQPEHHDRDEPDGDELRELVRDSCAIDQDREEREVEGVTGQHDGEEAEVGRAAAPNTCERDATVELERRPEADREQHGHCEKG